MRSPCEGAALDPPFWIIPNKALLRMVATDKGHGKGEARAKGPKKEGGDEGAAAQPRQALDGMTEREVRLSGQTLASHLLSEVASFLASGHALALSLGLESHFGLFLCQFLLPLFIFLAQLQNQQRQPRNTLQRLHCLACLSLSH
jgi:hypothetical protein